MPHDSSFPTGKMLPNEIIIYDYTFPPGNYSVDPQGIISRQEYTAYQTRTKAQASISFLFLYISIPTKTSIFAILTSRLSAAKPGKDSRHLCVL